MTQALLMPPPSRPADVDDVAPSLKGPVVAGILAVSIGFGAFLAWGYTARLDSAAVGSGSVVVSTKRKAVSHLEGGILRALLVQEGDRVRAGQPLATLENTRAKAELGQLQVRRVGFLAKLARLAAEQGGSGAISFPSDLKGEADPYVREILRNEALLFERRRETYQGTIEAQAKQIAVFAAEMDAAHAQLDAVLEQQKLIKSQIAAIQTLTDKGFASRAQLIELQGRLSVLVGAGGEYAANKARAEQSMAGAHLEIAKLRTTWQGEVADAMQQARIELSALADNITAAEDVLKRVDVVSPDDGVVTDIQFRTPGGVVGAGQTIMEVVPEHDLRIIEARIDPRDIDSARVGAEVRVRLSAYGMRQAAPLSGNLIYVAADQTVDEKANYAFYTIRAKISDEALAQAPSVTLYPGMPADVIVLNRPRLAIDYLLAPLTETFFRAFREE